MYSGDEGDAEGDADGDVGGEDDPEDKQGLASDELRRKILSSKNPKCLTRKERNTAYKAMGRALTRGDVPENVISAWSQAKQACACTTYNYHKYCDKNYDHYYDYYYILLLL